LNQITEQGPHRQGVEAFRGALIPDLQPPPSASQAPVRSILQRRRPRRCDESSMRTRWPGPSAAVGLIEPGEPAQGVDVTQDVLAT
jgi:hypothetical protein